MAPVPPTAAIFIAIAALLLATVAFPPLMAVALGASALLSAILSKFVFRGKPAKFFGIGMDFAKIRDYSFEAFALLLSVSLIAGIIIFFSVKLLSLEIDVGVCPWILLLGVVCAIAIMVKLALTIKVSRFKADFSGVPAWIKYLLKVMLAFPIAAILSTLLLVLMAAVVWAAYFISQSVP